jgi:hypothetical protein
MRAEFRYTRQGMSSPYDVSVRLEATPSKTFSVSLAPHISANRSAHKAVLLGVQTAFEVAAQTQMVDVIVVDIVDHSGATGDLGYKICGEAAMYHLIGLPEKAPFPGYVLGGA